MWPLMQTSGRNRLRFLTLRPGIPEDGFCAFRCPQAALPDDLRAGPPRHVSLSDHIAGEMTLSGRGAGDAPSCAVRSTGARASWGDGCAVLTRCPWNREDGSGGSHFPAWPGWAASSAPGSDAGFRSLVHPVRRSRKPSLVRCRWRFPLHGWFIDSYELLIRIPVL